MRVCLFLSILLVHVDTVLEILHVCLTQMTAAYLPVVALFISRKPILRTRLPTRVHLNVPDLCGAKDSPCSASNLAADLPDLG